ncbi:bifunctional phosphoribosyl-AMP cyclohydrolase/phosphoribosyl-ATP diphosphatase HisIE [soil metagenome]
MSILNIAINELAWDKNTGLLPVIVQDVTTRQVLMLAYMNREALQSSLDSKQVTFYSRSRQQQWVKGETSGNYLELVEIMADCDSDTLLILAKPTGPSCHRLTTSCFGTESAPGIGLLAQLNNIIEQRFQQRPEGSYTTRLFAEGTPRIAQKVGEEGVELALAAALNDKAGVIAEASDLIFHMLVLLQQCDVNLSDILTELRQRMEKLH